MMKPRVIIADTEEYYIAPIQSKFARDFFDLIDIEIITNQEYFNELFSKPQKAEILIVSEQLYDGMLQRHNISNIFVMMEQGEEQHGDLNVVKLSKYTNIHEIFNEILNKSAVNLNIEKNNKKETQIILVTSAAGGVGKTTVAMGISAYLTKSYKKVLYINASRLQSFQYLLENNTSISSSDIYSKLVNPTEDIYEDIKHVIRKELFGYLPTFKASLMSMGIDYSIYKNIAISAKKSGDFDFIIIDAESTFDENKTDLIVLADKVIIITEQTLNSVQATNLFVNNINGTNGDKYIFVCNKFDEEAYNALIVPESKIRFAINEYISFCRFDNDKKMQKFIDSESIQRLSFLLN